MGKGLTVNDLRDLCNDLIDEGFGNRHIQISQDDEGNGFHSLLFGFTTKDHYLKYWLDEGMFTNSINTTDDIVVLG